MSVLQIDMAIIEITWCRSVMLPLFSQEPATARYPEVIPISGSPVLEFSGVRAHAGVGAGEPINNDIGAVLPTALCGRTTY